MTIPNKLRVERFELALHEYRLSEATTRHCLIDLLADARHWCDCNGFDHADHDRMAYDQYVRELSEECDE